MTIRYVGEGGSDSNDGLSWAKRKLTLNGAEDTPVVAGDTVYVGPGVYREALTVDVAGTSGNQITYIGDVTGINTDGIGGVVRVSGSDDDIVSAPRSPGFSLGSGDEYRIFRGFHIDAQNNDGIRIALGNSRDIVIEDCVIDTQASNNVSSIEVINTGNMLNLTIRRCIFLGGATSSGNIIVLSESSVINDQNVLIENCLFIGGDVGIFNNRVGGVTVKNCTFLWQGTQCANVAQALDTGQTMNVNNCVFYGSSSSSLAAVTSGQLIEDYNNFWGNNADRNGNVATGSNSTAKTALLDGPLLFSDYKLGLGYDQSKMFAHRPASAQAQVAGTSEATDDLFGIARPTTSAKKSWGAIQTVNAEREAVITYGDSVASLGLRDAGRVPFRVAVTPVSTTFSVRVYREADYAGTLPQMIIKQPGETDDTTVDTGSAEEWNLLTTTLTPSANTDYVFIELVSNNTAMSGDYDAVFDDLGVA